MPEGEEEREELPPLPIKGLVLYSLLGGASIGWLMGLSVSPVTGLVVTSVISGLMALVVIKREPRPPSARESNEPKERRSSMDPAAWPASIALVVAIAATAPIGIIARTHAWFEPPAPNRLPAPGRSDGDSPTGDSKTAPATVAKDQGVLFNATQAECDWALGDPQELRSRLRSSTNPGLQSFADLDLEASNLKKVIERVCRQS